MLKQECIAFILTKDLRNLTCDGYLLKCSIASLVSIQIIYALIFILSFSIARFLNAAKHHLPFVIKVISWMSIKNLIYDLLVMLHLADAVLSRTSYSSLTIKAIPWSNVRLSALLRGTVVVGELDNSTVHGSPPPGV